MNILGSIISKCNRLSENIRHIKAIEVLYRLRNKQKHYLISSETPCRHTHKIKIKLNSASKTVKTPLNRDITTVHVV